MKKRIGFILLILLTVLTACVFAADPSVALAPAPTFLAWFSVNENAVLKFALAVSEFLGIFKAFQGNGILDTIVKGLRALYESRIDSGPTIGSGGAPA